MVLMRVVQLMVSSSSSYSFSYSSTCTSAGVISSPFHRWKPNGFVFRTNNNLSFFSKLPSTSTSTSNQPLSFSFFPLLSTHTFNTNTNTCCFRSAVRSESNSNSKSNHVSSKSQPLKVYFCQWCGSPTKQDIPDGDDKSRAICTSCAKVTYQNPKMVTGCLVEHDDKVLLCKRKIPPSYGLWTLPAGYMEMGESAVEGATRETWEEAGAEVEVMSPFAQLDIPLIGQDPSL
ncbi:hypothetical protein AQUCO_00900030v1 [Aquilegia coerulea]|uniref:Nudix hydrolase domain-containing protein n=1 Tax=Aquilegia coerulea TaxID=218851 RepID=A0A2G5EBM9_AQUCA|nr:hypothetical protein AQUCO_00900030v1 [Aquilegia coerulea]